METQAPAVPILARHVSRAGISEPERMYTLLPGRLVVESPGVPPMVYDLASVRRVRLKYDRGKARQYWFTILDTDHGQLRIRHSHFAGLANVEDRRATYTPLVLQLLAQLERYPDVQMKSGSVVSFAGLLLLIPFIVMIGVFALSIGRTDAVIVAGVMLLVVLLNLGRYRPRTITAAAPPRGLLPLRSIPSRPHATRRPPWTRSRPLRRPSWPATPRAAGSASPNGRTRFSPTGWWWKAPGSRRWWSAWPASAACT